MEVGIESQPPKRGRSLNACGFCRARKTKCDGKRPSCSTCEAREIQCSYTEVQPSKLEQALSGILTAMHGMESKINLLIGQRSPAVVSPCSIESSVRRDSNIGIGSSIDFKHLPDFEKLLNSDTELDDAFLIQNFSSLPVWNDSIELLEAEEENSLTFKIKQKPELLNTKIDNINLEVYKKSRLSYLENVYNEIPLLCYEKLQSCEAYNGDNKSKFETCVLCLVCALGLLSDSKDHKYWSSTKYENIENLTNDELPPGFEYILKSNQIKHELEIYYPLNIQKSILSTLTSFYYLKIGNLILFWNELEKSSENLHKILKRNILTEKNQPQDFIDVFKRLFWVNLNLEREFLKLFENSNEFVKPSNLLSLQKQIGLPSSCLPIKQNNELPAVFIDERNYYLFCFMSNLLLMNIDEENSKMLEIHSNHPIEEFSNLTNRLKDDLIIWSNGLPIDFDWNNFKSNDKNLILLKINFFKVLFSIDFRLLKKSNNDSDLIPGNMVKQLQIVSRSLIKTIRSLLNNFCKLEFLDGSIFLCFELLDKIYELTLNLREFEKIKIDITGSEFELMLKAIEKIEPYSHHSKLLKNRTEKVKKLIIESLQEWMNE